jgi:glycosyltransferase involved in cell wall biosynthesis
VTSWHLITGEYPPQPGGVSDYNAMLAEGLAKAGAEIHVWGPPANGRTPEFDGTTVHRIAGTWSPADLARLDEALSSFPSPRRLLVQYVPNAWGYKGLNFRFCHWVVKRCEQGDDIRLMVHEPFYPWRLWDKPTRWFLAAGHRWMMRTLLSASSQIYISIPAWEKCLRPYEPGNERAMTWLPIPSTIPVVSDSLRVAERRRQLAPDGQLILGSFGTFGGKIRKLLTRTLPPLLINHPERVGLLLGRGGESFASELRQAYPDLADRLIAPGGLSPELVSINLQTCDALLQPYADGVSSRRTSVMAGMAHGLPIVTTQGFLSESIWRDTGCVALVSAPYCSALIESVDGLLSEPARRASLGSKAQAVYSEHFALERTIEKILAD